MASRFSGALQLTDLDDFITPSQVSNITLPKLINKCFIFAITYCLNLFYVSERFEFFFLNFIQISHKICVVIFLLHITVITTTLPAFYLQECIKPVKIEKTKTKTGAKIKIGDDGYFDVSSGREQKLQKVEITLADCLACSGCITSAESILGLIHFSQYNHHIILTYLHN